MQRADPEDPSPRRLHRDLAALLGSVVGLGATGYLAVLALGALGAFAFTVPSCEIDIGDPGDGRDSQHLAVAAAPATDLADGTPIGVSSDAFAPHRIVGVAQCLAEAASVPRGVEACDTDGGQRFAVDADGHLTALVAARRVITVGGEAHDCAESAERCILVAADAGDYSLSGGVPLTFATDLPPVTLTARTGARPATVLLPGRLTPEGPVPAGATVAASASGFVPGEPVVVALCHRGFLTGAAYSSCDPIDTSTVVAVMTREVGTVALHADAAGVVATTVTVPAEVVPYVDHDDRSGAVDCTTEPGACAVVVAAAADDQRSSYLPLTVRP